MQSMLSSPHALAFEGRDPHVQVLPSAIQGEVHVSEQFSSQDTPCVGRSPQVQVSSGSSM